MALALSATFVKVAAAFNAAMMRDSTGVHDITVPMELIGVYPARDRFKVEHHTCTVTNKGRKFGMLQQGIGA